jgi:hypothetical protein
VTPPRWLDEDYESGDLESAAYLAQEDADPDYDQPTRAEAEADERECSNER